MVSHSDCVTHYIVTKLHNSDAHRLSTLLFFKFVLLSKVIHCPDLYVNPILRGAISVFLNNVPCS
jgi:hypothetical protein